MNEVNMNEVSIIQFYKIETEADILIEHYPWLRKGQCLHNIAFEKFPICVKEIPEEIDCFYVDSNIDAFLKALKKKIVEIN